MVVPPSASRRVASIEISAASASGAAPPYMPECTGPARVRTVTRTLPVPRRLVVTVGRAELDVAGVRDQHDVGGEQIGVGTHEGLESAGRHLLRALADDPYSHRPWPRQRPERAQQHHQVALAVGGAAAVPTPVALGELPRRGGPLPGIAGRLDVVVRVEEHGRRPGRSRRVAHDREAAVGGLDRRGRRPRRPPGTGVPPRRPPSRTPRQARCPGPPPTASRPAARGPRAPAA